MLIDHLFWGGRAYLAQSLMCAGGPKTASISTGPRTVRRRSEASEPCGAYRKRIEPRCREFRGSGNPNSTLGDTETAKNRHARAGPKSNQSRWGQEQPAWPQIAQYEPPCMPTEVMTGFGAHRW